MTLKIEAQMGVFFPDECEINYPPSFQYAQNIFSEINNQPQTGFVAVKFPKHVGLDRISKQARALKRQILSVLKDKGQENLSTVSARFPKKQIDPDCVEVRFSIIAKRKRGE